MSTSNLISLLILLSGVVAAGWALYNALARKIDAMDDAMENKIARVYERMDANKDQYYKNFVLEKVHIESQKNQDALNDQKFVSQMKVFESHLQYQTEEIKNLSNRIDGKRDWNKP